MVAPNKSTNVRSFNEADLPALAAQFFRPQRRQRVEPPPGSKPLSLAFRGLALRGWTLGEGPAVLLVHGWEGSSGQLAGMAQVLVAQGLSAVAFDFPAHGSSEGVASSVKEFAAALHEVEGAHGPFVGAVGHSLGGAAVCLAAMKVARLLLIAPAASPDHFIRAFASAVLPPELHGRFVEAVWAHARFTAQDVHAPTHVARFEGEVRVLGDPDDRQVPFAHGRSIAASAPAGSLRELPGTGHVGILSDARTLEEATRFFGPLRPGKNQA